MGTVSSPTDFRSSLHLNVFNYQMVGVKSFILGIAFCIPIETNIQLSNYFLENDLNQI